MSISVPKFGVFNPNPYPKILKIRSQSENFEKIDSIADPWCKVLHLPSEKEAHLENCHRYWKAKCKEAQVRCLVVSVCPYCKKKYVLLIMNEISLDISRKLIIITLGGDCLMKYIMTKPAL